MTETKQAPRHGNVAMLLFDSAPDISEDTLTSIMDAAPGASHLAFTKERAFAIAHPALTGEVEGKPVPLMTTGFLAAGAPDMDFSQAWGAEEALRARAAQASHHIAVVEMMALANPPAGRHEAFASTVALLAEKLGAFAVWHAQASNLHATEAIVESRDMLACNVRLFNISNDEGVMVMDTLGLDVYGLPDLQLHFRDLDPSEVARQLYNIALYVILNGDVFEDGHTVDGYEAGQVWRVQHEDALVAPERLVLDLDPGDPFAAGNRER